MIATEALHECLFCPQTFGSAAKKDDHTLEHFAQEKCTECNQNLIRIGNSLYTQHNAVTCIKRELKTELLFESCFVDRPILHDEIQQECGILNTDISKKVAKNMIQIKNEPVITPDYNQRLLLNTKAHLVPMKATYHTEKPMLSLDSIHLDELNIKTEPIIQYEQQHDPFIHAVDSNTNKNSTVTSRSMRMKSTEKELQNQSNQSTNREICNRTTAQVQPSQHLSSKTSCSQVVIMGENTLSLASSAQNEIQSKKSNKFECDICGRIYTRSSSLKCHRIRVHSKPGTHYCYICCHIFPTEKELTGHKVTCQLKMKKQNAAKKSRNKNASYECHLCHKPSPTYPALLAHFRLKHSPDAVRWKCNICLKGFSTNFVLNMHMKCHNPYVCNICKEIFLTSQSLRIHMQSKHIPKIKLKCEKCGAVFMEKSALENHYKSHEERAQHTCNICGRIYTRSTSLKCHKIRVHSKPGTHYCHICCLIFSTEKELTEHKVTCQLKKKKRNAAQKSRNKDAIYECHLCHKPSPTYPAILAHFRLKHSADAIRFKCNICGLGLSTNFILNKHIKRHNQSLNDRKFMCTVCGKYLGSKEAFKGHMYIHTGEKPFKCLHDGCGKSFRFLSTRQEHMRIHTGEKPYHCTIDGCDKRFGYSTDFRRHKFKIHGIFTKKVNCSICNDIFLDSTLLKAHMKKHKVKT